MQVLEFYCQTGYSEYLQAAKNVPATHGDVGDGWITCDTLMTPEDSTKYDQLQLATGRLRTGKGADVHPHTHTRRRPTNLLTPMPAT